MKLLLSLLFAFQAHASAPRDYVYEGFHTGLAILFDGLATGGGSRYQGDHPNDPEKRQGTWVLSTGTTNEDARALIYATAYNYFLSGINQTNAWRACLPAASTGPLGYKAFIGYGDFGFVGGNYPRGPMFMYTHDQNGGNWQAVLRKWTGSGDVDVARIDTGVPWDEHCHVFSIKVVPQQSIEWWIDGEMVAQTASALPTSGEPMYPFSMIQGTYGFGARTMVVDWVELEWIPSGI